MYEQATLHTSVGDIHVQLFPKECPKTVENFCVHSRNGYYNGHIFHRVIKQFMIQVGFGHSQSSQRGGDPFPREITFSVLQVGEVSTGLS